MPNEQGGAIQVLDNTVEAINQALAQVLERVDDLKGLRGPVTIHDRMSVDAPLDPSNAVTLESLINDFAANVGAPYAWPALSNTQRPSEMQGEDSQLDPADPLLWTLTDRLMESEEGLQPHDPFLWIFGGASSIGVGSGQEPQNPPPEVENASAIGTVLDRYAAEDHTHSGVNLGDAQTITGAKTFDLDPAAPFVVTASSAVVANLDSDKWDGQEYTTGTFTITGTGFTDPDPTGTALYVKLGALVVLFIPDLTGTSDATTFTLTGLPAAITPTRNGWYTTRGTNNSVNILIYLRFNGGSTTVDLFTNASGAGWTAANTKHITYTWVAYALL